MKLFLVTLILGTVSSPLFATVVRSNSEYQNANQIFNQSVQPAVEDLRAGQSWSNCRQIYSETAPQVYQSTSTISFDAAKKDDSGYSTDLSRDGIFYAGNIFRCWNNGEGCDADSLEIQSLWVECRINKSDTKDLMICAYNTASYADNQERADGRILQDKGIVFGNYYFNVCEMQKVQTPPPSQCNAVESALSFIFHCD